MELADLSAGMSYAELAKAYDEHAEPFQTLSQVNVFLRVASMLRRRVPAETEHNGERIQLRDIDLAMIEARKARVGLTMRCQPATVIVPPDDLR